MKHSYFRPTHKTLPAFLIAAAIVALALLAVPKSSSEKADVPSTNTTIPIHQSLSVSETVPGAEFIGYRHKGVLRGEKLPNGVQDLGGGLLTDDDYGVTRFSIGDKYMLWLGKILEFDADDVPTWEVKDVLVFDKLKKNQMFMFSYSSPCTDGGAENLDLIVMVEENRKRRTYTILKAWLANTETERFEETTTGSIVCSYDSKS